MKGASMYNERTRKRLERYRQVQASTQATNSRDINSSSGTQKDNKTEKSAYQKSRDSLEKVQHFSNSQHYTPPKPSPASLRAVQVLISPRPLLSTEFTPETWWIVDRQYRPRLQQGATPLLSRCIYAYGWSETYARRVLASYKQFLQLKTVAQDWDGSQLEPSKEIGKLWQQHILDVVNYFYDCILLCGHVLGHLPNDEYSIMERNERKRNTKQALEKMFKDFDKDIWRDILSTHGNWDIGDKQGTQESDCVHKVQEEHSDETAMQVSDCVRGTPTKNSTIRRTARMKTSHMMTRNERKARSPRQERPSLKSDDVIQTGNHLERNPGVSRFSTPIRHRVNSPRPPESNLAFSSLSNGYQYSARIQSRTPPISKSPASQTSPQEAFQTLYRPQTPVLDTKFMSESDSAFQNMSDNAREERIDIPTTRDLEGGRLGYEIDTEWGVQSFELLEEESQHDFLTDPIDARRQEYQQDSSVFGDSKPFTSPFGNLRQIPDYSSNNVCVVTTNGPKTPVYQRHRAADVPDDRKPITIHIRDQDGMVTSSRARRSTKLGRVFASYAISKGVRPTHLNFFLNGNLIDTSETAEILKMKDNDKIDCVIGHHEI